MLAGGGGALLASRALAARTAEPALTPAAMRSDVALLHHAYATLHPGLLRYATAAKTAARFDALANACAWPLPLGDFYLRLSALLATVRCGHSYANFYNQRRAVQTALFEAPDRLPLGFLWSGDRMVVTADPFGAGIVPGSEVIAIDGRPAAAVLAGLMPYARADGHNDAKRRRLLSVQHEDGYESFDIFYPLRFGGSDRYRLTVRGPDGRHRTESVAAVSLAQRRAARIMADARSEAPQWTIERRGGAAVLTMSNWGLYDSKWDWRGWLDTAVDRLIADRVPALVVDIRHNEGGQDCGDALIARLIDRPVVADPVHRLVRYATLPADLRPYCDTWDRSFDRLGVGAGRFDDRFLELTGNAHGDPAIEPKGARYPGRVVVLVGPQNSSATFQFAQRIARAGLATLVGEETGGNQRGINGGCFYFFRLPATGIEVDVPLIGEFPLAARPDAGVRPAVTVAPTAAAIAAGRDPVMERALAMLG